MKNAGMINLESLNKRILITGVSGYVGSHVLDALIKSGIDSTLIFGADNFSSSHKTNALDQINFHHVDLCNFNETMKLIRIVEPDMVIHLAGNRFARRSSEFPFEVYSSNTIATINLCEALRLVNPMAFIVFSSSCSVYGNANSVVVESHVTNPISPYGRSKVACENALLDFKEAGGPIPVILRYFNAAGYFPGGLPDQHTEGLLSNLVYHCRKDYEFPIFGVELDTRDGTCIRDYISVRDIARAHIYLTSQVFKKGSTESEIYNLGSGNGSTVLEIINAFNTILKQNVKTRNAPSSPMDPLSIAADFSKFSKEFGWFAQDDIEIIISSLKPLLTN
jgi:UDP-glucose 4-epimerase